MKTLIAERVKLAKESSKQTQAQSAAPKLGNYRIHVSTHIFLSGNKYRSQVACEEKSYAGDIDGEMPRH